MIPLLASSHVPAEHPGTWVDVYICMGRAQWLQGPNSPFLALPLAAKSCHRQKNLHFPWDGSTHNTSCSACLGLQPTRPYFCVPVFPNTLRLSGVCTNYTRSYITHTPSALKTERWRVGRGFWKRQEFHCLYQTRVKTLMPDKATVTTPWRPANGPKPTPSQQKLTWKKNTNSEPNAISQHQLKTENVFFWTVSQSCPVLCWTQLWVSATVPELTQFPGVSCCHAGGTGKKEQANIPLYLW